MPRNPWFLLPWAVTIGLFWLYPLVYSFWLSLCTFDAFRPDAVQFVGWTNYARLWTDGRFHQAFANTLWFVLGTAPATTVLGLALALLVGANRRFLGFLRGAFFLPSILSMVVIATVFKTFYAPEGLLNVICGGLGLGRHAWLVETAFALPAIMVLDVWASVGYSMVLFLAALQAVPPGLYEAAEIDGANPWQRFRFITLPQIRAMAAFVVVINLIRTWQVFPEVYTLTRGGPLGTTDTVVHRLYETAFRFQEMGYSSAMAWVLLLIVFGLSLVQMHWLEGRRR